MPESQAAYFDQAAATRDDHPVRRALMKAVAEGLVRELQLTPTMDVLDYGSRHQPNPEFSGWRTRDSNKEPP